MKRVLRGYFNYYKPDRPFQVKTHHFEVETAGEVATMERKFSNPVYYRYVGKLVYSHFKQTER